MYKNKKNVIGLFVALGLLITLSTKPVYAGQYGEDCDDCNTAFRITKEVRIKGDSNWKDKVSDVKASDIIEFRITIKNKSDGDADAADDMEMEDFLPDEMSKVGGSGLTESWDNFDPDDTKVFVIEAKVNASEYNRDVKFEKCVVNKAELTWDGDYEGSDTATVCYGNVTPSELPETGAETAYALAGLGMLVTGLVARKKFNK